MLSMGLDGLYWCEYLMNECQLVPFCFKTHILRLNESQKKRQENFFSHFVPDDNRGEEGWGHRPNVSYQQEKIRLNSEGLGNARKQYSIAKKGQVFEEKKS